MNLSQIEYWFPILYQNAHAQTIPFMRIVSVVFTCAVLEGTFQQFKQLCNTWCVWSKRVKCSRGKRDTQNQLVIDGYFAVCFWALNHFSAEFFSVAKNAVSLILSNGDWLSFRLEKSKSIKFLSFYLCVFQLFFGAYLLWLCYIVWYAFVFMDK